MATVLQTKLMPVLTAVRDKLVGDAVVTKSNFHFTAHATPPAVVLQGDETALAIPLEQQSDAGTYYGGGRRTTLARTRLDVYLRVTSSVDEIGTDDAMLTADPHSLFALSHKVESALQEYLPEDADGNALIAEPFMWLRTGRPRRDMKSSLFGDIVCEFAFAFWKDYP